MNKEYLITFLIVGIVPILLILLGYHLLGVASIFIGGTYFIWRSNYKHW